MAIQPPDSKNINDHALTPEQIKQITNAVREQLTKDGFLTGAGALQTSQKQPEADESVPPGVDQSLASKIDHTLLKPDATVDEVKRVCEEARKYHFATVCLNSMHIAVASQILKGSSTKPIAVVGFPLGTAASVAKAFEAREAIRLGAQEIDMVINIGALKGRDYALVFDDIKQVVEASKPFGVKVILETSSLNEDQKITGCALAKAAGAAFVKTSTGFAAGGATVEDVALMRRIVGPDMGVKASGGIRTYEDAVNMIAAGATRIGASASIAIVTKQSGGAKNGY